MNVAFFSTKAYDCIYFNQFNPGFSITYFEAPLDEATLNLTKGFEVVCVFVNDHLPAAVMKGLAANGVQLIALRCAGFNNTDLNAATTNRLKVVRVPAYSPYAVAEHAIALLLTLNRKTHKAYNRVKEGNFSLDRLTGFDLHGKTVGVIGTGKIGQVCCQILLGFGCKVLAFDLVANKAMEALGVVYAPLLDVLQQSDVLTLHCPLTEQTKHLINQQTIALMKPGVMLINTSRGALIDTPAVIDALKTGQIAYLGLDVYEQEDTLFFNDLSESVIQDDQIQRLCSFPNVLVTAHQGFFTREALTQIAQITWQSITDFSKGLPLANALN